MKALPFLIALLSSTAFAANADTRALQHAIDSGKPIESRTYVIDESIRIPSNVDINGNGARIKAADQAWTLVADDHMGMFNANRQTNIRIRNFRFDGLSGQKHDRTPKLIYFRSCQWVTVEDCHFEGHGSEGVWGGVDDGLFRRLVFERVGKVTPGGRWYALPALQPFGDRLTIEDNTLLDCGSGIGPTGRDVTVRRNRVVDVLQDGIAIGDSARMAEGPAVVEDNYVELTAKTKVRQSGIRLVGARDAGSILVANNHVMVGTEGKNPARAISIDNATDTTFRDNEISWDGNSVGFEAGGSKRGICVTTQGNRLVSLDGKGRGFVITPSKGRKINWHSERDAIYGVDPGSFALDCADYRGGTVHARVESTYIESGYARDTERNMTAMTQRRISL